MALEFYISQTLFPNQFPSSFIDNIRLTGEEVETEILLERGIYYKSLLHLFSKGKGLVFSGALSVVSVVSGSPTSHGCKTQAGRDFQYNIIL